MKKLIVSTATALGLAAAVVAPAVAQSVRVGATVRIADDVVVGIAYGHPHPTGVLVYERPHYDRVDHRHARAHGRLARRHHRWHAVEREHRKLHRALRRGSVSAREHRRWHHANAFEHGEEHRVRRHAHRHP